MKKIFTLTYLVKTINGLSEAVYLPEERCTDQVEPVMDFETHTPSKQTIQRILDFARAYDTLETRSAGHVEMILN